MRVVEQVPVLSSMFGRTALLDSIAELLAQPRSWQLLLTGSGGVGKTRLLQAVKDILARQNRPQPEIFDFFHIDNFKASQIEDAIIQSMRAYKFDAIFTPYQQQRAAVERTRQSGEQFNTDRAELRRRFVACYNNAARQLQQRGQLPIVLIFDTVEQAVNLTDRAEQVLLATPLSANDGGEAWLREILPQLQYTQVLLSGRPETLYGSYVALYDELVQRAGAQVLPVEGIAAESVSTFMAAIQERFLHSPHEIVRMRAHTVPLSKDWLDVCALVADGHPFWLTMLFTAAMLAALPPEIDDLRAWQRGEIAQPPTSDASELRAALMRKLLATFDDSQEDTVLALQWLATARKGLSLAMLQTIAAQEQPTMDTEQVFAYLKELLIVKTRSQSQRLKSPIPGTAADEVRLFLHDEMYAWLDQNQAGTIQLRPTVAKALLDWYDEAIADTERQRLAAVERRLELGERHQDTPALHDHEAAALQQSRQLLIDRLGYIYELDYEQGRFAYNLHSYTAITTREYDYGITLRQEALRNSYRQQRMSHEEEIECAARWALRALWSEDKVAALALLPQLANNYHLNDPRHSGVAYTLLRVAAARVLQEFAPHPQQIDHLLAQAEHDIDAEPIPQPDGGAWCDMLRAEIHNYRGLLYRREYALYDAVEQYRLALAAGGHWQMHTRAEQGKTCNNLAFAYSEQGMVDEARRYGRRGLELNRRYSTPYFIGLSYNTLARIELRAGAPLRARQYARQARAIFRQLNSAFGLGLCMPVLAHTYRREAELLDDDRPAQRRTFDLAITTYREALRQLWRDRSKRHDLWRETRQGLGVAYRSLGQALRRYNPHDPQVQVAFRSAHKWLERARWWAEHKQQPALIQLDLNKDLAVVHVNADEFDSRITYHLEQAEAFAPSEYQLQQGQGLPSVDRSVRGFWRELGQCQLQRMLSAFGAFDYGYYAYDPLTGRSPQPLRKGDANDLRNAAHHMVLLFEYLIRYNRTSTIFERAIYLAQRELLFNRTSEQIKLMLQAAYHTASEYNLLENDSLKLTEELLEQALQDVDLFIDDLQSNQRQPL